MTQNNKQTFTVKIDDKDVELAVLRPNFKVKREGEVIYSSAFREAVKPSSGRPGALVRDAIENVMRDQQLWDDAREQKFQELKKSVEENERKLKKGGIPLSEAKDAAIQIRRARVDLSILRMKYNELDANSAEAQAENARFNYYVANCTVHADSGKNYFRDLDDYMNRDEDDPVVAEANKNLGQLLYGLGDYQKKLPENEFLLKYKLCNENLHLVDKDGNLVNVKGERVDKDGHLLNADGERVDEEGNRLDENGEVIVEFSPFLDDEGEAIVLEGEKDSGGGVTADPETETVPALPAE